MTTLLSTRYPHKKMQVEPPPIHPELGEFCPLGFCFLALRVCLQMSLSNRSKKAISAILHQFLECFERCIWRLSWRTKDRSQWGQNSPTSGWIGGGSTCIFLWGRLVERRVLWVSCAGCGGIYYKGIDSCWVASRLCLWDTFAEACLSMALVVFPCLFHLTLTSSCESPSTSATPSLLLWNLPLLFK